MSSNLIGKTIANIRPMTTKEMKSYGWDGEHAPPVLVLSDGTKLFPSRDPEGNRPGALFGERGKDSFILTNAGRET